MSRKKRVKCFVSYFPKTIWAGGVEVLTGRQKMVVIVDIYLMHHQLLLLRRVELESNERH